MIPGKRFLAKYFVRTCSVVKYFSQCRACDIASMSNLCPLLLLPDDVLELILTHMKIDDLGRCCSVSRRLQRVASGNYLWQAKIASLALWRSWDKYASTPSKPLARIGLRLEEFLHVHFAMLAARAAESSSAKQGILFRGVEYDIERQNHTSSNLRRPFPSCLQVKTPRYLFVLHQEEEESMVGMAQQVEEKGKIKIFYDGCTAVRTFTKYAPVQAAPSAHGELGYAKFTYCHIVMHFLSRCTACAQASVFNWHL